MPVIEAFEAEQEFDDSSAELKADLCESIRRFHPEPPGDALMSQVLAGQLVLVFEQHRAKVNRRCRSKAHYSSAGVEFPALRGGSFSADRTMMSSSSGRAGRASRFSVVPYVAQAAGGAPPRRRSRIQSMLPRTSSNNSHSNPSNTSAMMTAVAAAGISPASSVYSQRSSSSSRYSSSSSRPATRSSSLSTTSRGGSSSSNVQVESPRLPFRDWVHSVKLHGRSGSSIGSIGSSSSSSSSELASYPGATTTTPPPPASHPPTSATVAVSSGSQRDSGLALPCEGCGADPCACACGSYADQLSAFMMTPGAARSGAVAAEGEEGDAAWVAHYGGQDLLLGAEEENGVRREEVEV